MDKYRSDVLKFKELTENSVFYCFDTETTGLKPGQDDIIEFAALKFEGKGGKYTSVYSIDILINPGYPVSEEIINITGITNEMLKDAVGPKEAAEKIHAFLGDAPVVMGYNSISFDSGFMESLYRKNLGIGFEPAFHLDVLKMAREKQPGSHKLCNMAEAAGFKGEGFHRAGFDAAATEAVFEWLLPMYDEPEPKADTEGFEIKNVKHWQKSETLDRLYVGNSKNYSIYLDIPRKEWNINANMDDSEVIAKVYAFAGVKSDEELIEAYKVL